MTIYAKQPPKSLLARILSLEGAMAAFGLYSLASGLRAGEVLQMFWGVMILGGLCILMAVRRRDWKKHWEEMATTPPPQPSTDPPPPTDTSQREQ